MSHFVIALVLGAVFCSACNDHQPEEFASREDELLHNWKVADLWPRDGDALRRAAMDLAGGVARGDTVTAQYQRALDDAWVRVLAVSHFEIMRAAKDYLALLVYHLATRVSDPIRLKAFAFEQPWDDREVSALDDIQYYQVRHMSFRDEDGQGLPTWPEELLTPDAFVVSDATRVRLSVVFSGITALVSSNRYDVAVDLLEQIMNEPEACVDRSGAKVIACRIVRYVIRSAPDLTYATRRMVDDLLLAGDPCITPTLISCLWDNPWKHYDNGLWR